MSRFLFVILPLPGHINPAAAVARALTERGHDVAWVGSQARFRPLLGPDATIYPTGMRPYGGQADTGMASVKSLWESFVIPFARFTLPVVERAVDDYQPDAVVVDQHALAGALAAERRGLTWATLVTSSLELGQPFSGLPKVQAWIQRQMSDLWVRAGLPGTQAPDLRFSPFLVIAFTGAALTGELSFPAHFALVGPALAGRPPGPDFPWDWLDQKRRHVLVTVGTMAENNATDSTNFYARAAAALGPLGDTVQGIMIAPAWALPDQPAHIMVTPRVPLLELMPRLDAVVCHGGLNTVCESLSFGVPLVVAPLTRDQPINAAQVVAAGAGIRVRFSRVTPGQLRAAVLTVLDDPRMRIAAGQIRDSFAAAGGAAAAARRLEQMPMRPRPAATVGERS